MSTIPPTTGRRRLQRAIWPLAVLVAAATVSRSASAAAGAQPLVPPPDSMVVLGHSGATGYNSDPTSPRRDATENSWATGTNPDVDSIYLRLLATNPAIKDHNFNLAEDGSQVQDLIYQAKRAVRLVPPPGLVLIQTVDNDMHCDGHDDEFLPLYGSKLHQALKIITDGLPAAKVFIISQPGSVESYTKSVKDNPIAVAHQSLGQPCDVFDKAGNILPAGESYIEGVLQSFFTMIAGECAGFANCTFDQTHDHRLEVVSADVTPDSNHLSVSGQRKVAAAIWEALNSTNAAAPTAKPPACPNPDGGAMNHCIGDLTPGTYTTTKFGPKLTYTVGAGWANMEDLPGNFLLIPPGGSLQGVNPMTSDFLGVYRSVAPPLPCEERPAPDVAPTPQAFVDFLRAQPQLSTSEPRSTSVGGLKGLRIDVSLVNNKACSDPNIAPAFALVLMGTGASGLTHAVVPDYPLRLYLLESEGGVLAVELADAPDGGSQYEDWWTSAQSILRTFEFAEPTSS